MGTLKCQVCEGGPSPGVCQDPDDKGISKECQSWETACFFTKTVVNGGGATAYRNCYMANSDYCQSYAYSGVSTMKDFCVIMYIVVMYMVFFRRKALLVTVPAII